MATGTDLPGTLEPRDIIFERLVRVMASATIGACEMRVVISIVTTGTLRNRIFCWWVCLVTIDTSKLTVSTATGFKISKSLLVTADAVIRESTVGKLNRRRGVMTVTLGAVGSLHLGSVAFVTIKARR